MSGHPLHLANGICLLAAFFFARICFGFYMSYRCLVDVWAVHEQVPLVLLIVYGGGNILLNILNVNWFGKMIRSVQRRFSVAKAKKGSDDTIDTSVVKANGESAVKSRRTARKQA